MSFEPPCCPAPRCPSHDLRSAWRYRCKGSYVRACDGRRVQRFVCGECGRGFSEQTFRGNYRYKKPHLDTAVLRLLVSKVTLRQIARVLGVNKKTVARRVPRFGSMARAVHEHLAPARDDERIGEGAFLLDELETYADSRRNNPLTVPVLVHRESLFVLHAEVGPLPRRGGRGRDEKPPEELTDEEDRARRRGSREAVGACCERLRELAREEGPVVVRTDEKHSYAWQLKEALGDRLEHETTHSKEPRSWRNPLFRVNLTLAMMRDGISRLVRRTWAASKREERLRDHLWIWIAWRDFVRGHTNRAWHETPAMLLGICRRKLRDCELLRWRSPFVARLLRV